jgi:hypothetical protein
MKQLARTLDQLADPVTVFFRNDDAGWEQDRLASLIALFAERGFPLDLAVIPAALDPATARELLALRRTWPALGLHQHGYAHINHERSGGRKCEFGEARPLARQLADVIAGRERLNGLLGDWDPIFTPPWNRCSAELCLALGDHGFALLSTDRQRGDAGAITQLPVQLDWNRARREGQLEAKLCTLFETARGPAGIMFHHATMDQPAREELAVFLDVLSECSTIEALPMRHWLGE